MLPDSRRNSLFSGMSSSGRSWAVQEVNGAEYDARVSVLTEAAMIALSRRRWAHIVVHARASRSLVATFWVCWGPLVSNVTPSILIEPWIRRGTQVGDQCRPWMVSPLGRAGLVAGAGPNAASQSLARDSFISKRTVNAKRMSRCRRSSEAAVDTRSSA